MRSTAVNLAEGVLLVAVVVSLMCLLLRWLWHLSFRNRDDDNREYRDMVRRRIVRRCRRLQQMGIMMVHMYIVVEVITWNPGERNRRQTFVTPVLTAIDLFLLDVLPALRRRWSITMVHVVSFALMFFVFAGLVCLDWYVIQRSMRRRLPQRMRDTNF